MKREIGERKKELVTFFLYCQPKRQHIMSKEDFNEKREERKLNAMNITMFLPAL